MIYVKYKCVCMQKELEISMVPRRTNEPIEDYMHMVVMPTIYLDHRMRNPTCMADEIEEVKIPMDGDKPIGQEPQRH